MMVGVTMTTTTEAFKPFNYCSIIISARTPSKVCLANITVPTCEPFPHIDEIFKVKYSCISL